MGCRQWLPLSVVQLKGTHCRKPHCHNGVVDMIGLYAIVINFSLIFAPPPLLKNDDVIYGWPLTTHLCTQDTNCALSLEHFDSNP